MAPNLMNQNREIGFPELRPANTERKKHLDMVKGVRKDNSARDMEFMAPMMSIPPLDWAVLKRRFPELIAPDAQIQKQAWNVFMKHPASEPYRVKEQLWRPITAS